MSTKLSRVARTWFEQSYLSQRRGVGLATPPAPLASLLQTIALAENPRDVYGVRTRGFPFAKEHRARALADAWSRDLASRRPAAVRSATVKTACKKLFSLSRSMFLRLAACSSMLRRAADTLLAKPKARLGSVTAADSKNSAGFFTDLLLAVGALIGARGASTDSESTDDKTVRPRPRAHRLLRLLGSVTDAL